MREIKQAVLIGLILALSFSTRGQEGPDNEQKQTTIITATGKSFPVKDFDIDEAQGKLVVKIKDNQTTVDANSVGKILFSNQELPSREIQSRDVSCYMTNGDVLNGKLDDGKENCIVLKVWAMWDKTVSLRNEWVSQIKFLINEKFFPAQDLGVEATNLDVLLSRDGDKWTGTLKSLSKENCVFESKNFGEKVFPLNDIVVIYLTKLENPPKEPDDDLWSVIVGADGTSLRGRIKQLRSSPLVNNLA